MVQLQNSIVDTPSSDDIDELPVSQAVRARRSRRAFAERPVEPYKLELMLQAARWAASRSNKQPWYWIVVQGEPALSKTHAALNPTNAWAAKAPLLMVVATNPEEDTFKDDRKHYIMDCGQSVGQLLLQGAALGVMTHVLAGWDAAGVKAALNIPDPVQVLAVIAVGYMGNPDLLDEETRMKDLAPKPRHHPSHNIFADGWQNPFPLGE